MPISTSIEVSFCNAASWKARSSQKTQSTSCTADVTSTSTKLGFNQMKLVPKKQLSAGEVGYIVAGVKSVQDIEIGDTITLLDRPAAEPIPGYQKARQVVFSSIYPMSTDQYVDLTKALDKLAINDALLTYEKDSSAALGLWFSLRFPRTATPGCDSRATAAGIRHWPGHLGTVGEVQINAERWLDSRSRQSQPLARPDEASSRLASPTSRRRS